MFGNAKENFPLKVAKTKKHLKIHHSLFVLLTERKYLGYDMLRCKIPL